MTGVLSAHIPKKNYHVETAETVVEEKALGTWDTLRSGADIEIYDKDTIIEETAHKWRIEYCWTIVTIRKTLFILGGWMASSNSLDNLI